MKPIDHARQEGARPASFHSDISPFRINDLRAVRNSAAQNRTRTSAPLAICEAMQLRRVKEQ